MSEARLRAISYHLPANIVTNDALSIEHPEWDVARIAGKTGIEQRHVVGADECASDLAFAAADRLLGAMDVPRDAIDVLIFCTQTPDHFLPTTACILQDRLGLSTRTAAFDINQGCSGYVYGLVLAQALIRSRMARNVLLLTGDTYSRLVHPGDRTVRVLFGDAGTASLISNDDHPGATLGTSLLGTDGRGAENLIVPAGGFRKPSSAETQVEMTDSIGCTRTADNLFMNGQAISNFVMSTVPNLVRETAEAAGRTLEDIDWFVFHQANAFIQDRIRMLLKIPAERVPVALKGYGNTVSSTIPIVLADHGHRMKEGDNVLLAGFGVGYSWGAQMLAWGDVQLFPSISSSAHVHDAHAAR